MSELILGWKIVSSLQIEDIYLVVYVRFAPFAKLIVEGLRVKYRRYSVLVMAYRGRETAQFICDFEACEEFFEDNTYAFAKGVAKRELSLQVRKKISLPALHDLKPFEQFIIGAIEGHV